MRRGPRHAPLVAVAMSTVLLAGACSRGGAEEPQVVIGVSSTTAAGAGATIAVAPRSTLPADPGPVVDLTRKARPEPGRVPGLAQPDGHPYGGTVMFRSATPVPTDLAFVAVVGSDARPNEDVRRSNGDAVHIIAVNPQSGEGTIVDIPRDAWVEVPGKGNRKLSEALRGGPEQELATLRKLSGLPIKYYVLAGFTGFSRMVDDLGGVNVFVDRRMNDPYSGARFERGWHKFSGQDALAYSRNRHDTAHGDFSRTVNQGNLILAALAKLRAEVTDDDGVKRWGSVLLRHVHLDMSVADVGRLGTVAARLDPKKVRNVVTPGRVGTAEGQSVVFLGAEAASIFNDLRDDAVVGRAGPATTTTTEPPPTTTSTTTPAGTTPPLLGSSSTSTTSSTSTSVPGTP